MDHGSTLGALVRFLIGFAGLGIGLFLASLGFANDGHVLQPTALLPGWSWALGLGGGALALGSILWVFTPRRDAD